MKNISFIVTILFFFITGTELISAQSGTTYEEWQKKNEQNYADFAAKNEKDFRNYREKVNAEYAEFIRKRWDEFRIYQGIPAPKMPEPTTPPIADPDKKPTITPLPFRDIVPLPTPQPRPKPMEPFKPVIIPDTEIISPKPTFKFYFFNTECAVNLNNSLSFNLPDTKEETIAQTWKHLSGRIYETLISDCLNLRDILNLCDWGYIQMLKQMSEDFLGKTSNEAVLLQMFILTQSGYKVRMAKAGNRLALLLPSQQSIYEYSYLNIKDIKYYIIDKELNRQALYVCNQEFPKEQYFSLQTGQPRLSVSPTSPKTFTSKRYPEIRVTVKTNKNLIDFYNTYPLSNDWNLYSLASISETLKHDLYPALRQYMEGKSEVEAANQLLNFVQTAFSYQTDEQQFGYERPFFADETFFYPYSDCEDRAILYSILIKDLLGLDVVLLHYPNHLATAVCFHDNIAGDYINITGKKFTVCDPTFIGAPVGMAMNELKNVQARVIRL